MMTLSMVFLDTFPEKTSRSRETFSLMQENTLYFMLHWGGMPMLSSMASLQMYPSDFSFRNMSESRTSGLTPPKGR